MANNLPQTGPVPVPLPAGALSPLPPPSPIVYPESDGKPMADNTKQARWIVVLYDNLKALYRHRPDVFIAADHFWYAVEGEPRECTAPDVMVVFGRPMKDRGSYQQWEEENVPVTVAFEVLSPGNTEEEMTRKFHFYEDHGVEEYYLYDPDRNRLEVYLRHRTVLRREYKGDSHISKRLGIRFELSAESEMMVYYPDGQRFLSFEELTDERERERKRADDEKQRADDERQRADDERQRADDERQRADDEKQRADDERQRADDEKQRADDQKQRADEERQRADDQKQRADDVQKMARRLAELSRRARRGEATPDELNELERLEEAEGLGAP